MTTAPHDGEAGVLVAVFGMALAVALTCCMLLTGLGARAGERARAQAGADAAALAGAIDGEAGARAIASANGVEVVEFIADGAAVEVRVLLGEVAAVARAERQIRPPQSG